MALTYYEWIGIAVGVVLFIALLKCYFNGGTNKYYPSLAGKTIVITGGNTGLGFIAAVEMAKLKPDMIIMACRSEQRATDAIRDIKKKVPGAPLEWIPCDLNDLASVKQFAETFNAKYDKIDILLNNAGIMALPERKTTVQGYEQ
jgi:NAD(P)-dependent dehydrogenase (short-subunit alcohol dehydrogenase family)